MQVLIPDRGPRGASSSPEDGAGAGAEDPSSAPAPQRPAILMVHGGCFSLGNNHMLDRNARWYAGRGFNVYNGFDIVLTLFWTIYRAFVSP